MQTFFFFYPSIYRLHKPRTAPIDPSMHTHPELRADGGLASGGSHLHGLFSVPAAHALKEVVDEVEPDDTQFVFPDAECVTGKEGRSDSRQKVFVYLLSLRMNKMSSLKVSLFFSRMPRAS